MGIKLSIIIATYCQERYIKQAICSVLAQKTNFPFEVFIGEDFSTDTTAEVLRELELKCPENYHFLYRDYNMGVDGNNADMVKRATGDYLLFLEGDDYFIDTNKLQKQVDFLDAHPDYIAVAHNTEIVGADGLRRDDFVYPECKEEFYSMKHFGEDILAGQTATLMFRNFYRDRIFPVLNIPFSYPGDQQKMFMLAAWGKIYCIQEKWSAYRYVPEFGSSYVATNKPTFAKEMEKFEAVKCMYRYTLDNRCGKETVKACEAYYMKLLTRGVLVYAKGKLRLRDWITAFFKCKYKISTFNYLFMWQFKKRILRRK